MAYVTEEQLLHHIKNGKSLGWLVTATGKNPGELEDIALRAGYVFGSNGVGRRSSIPDDTGEHSTDDTAWSKFLDRAGVEALEPSPPPDQAPDPASTGPDAPPEPAGAVPGPAAESGRPQGGGEPPAYVPEYEDPGLPWRRLLELGREAPQNATRTKAERLARYVDELMADLARNDSKARALAEVERLRNELRQAELIAFGAPRRPAPNSRAERMRDWARLQGMPVGGSGPLPTNIVQAYDDAHRDAS